MCINILSEDNAIESCFPVMQELRPHLAESEFVARVREQAKSGYRLAALEQGGEVVAVAGFRVGENLAWGRFLYVDDLVTAASHRSRGYGAQMLSWLREHAREQGCGQLHLDSGLQREAAHRFYEREGVSRAGYHFAETLSGG